MNIILSWAIVLAAAFKSDIGWNALTKNEEINSGRIFWWKERRQQNTHTHIRFWLMELRFVSCWDFVKQCRMRLWCNMQYMDIIWFQINLLTTIWKTTYVFIKFQGNELMQLMQSILCAHIINVPEMNQMHAVVCFQNEYAFITCDLRCGWKIHYKSDEWILPKPLVNSSWISVPASVWTPSTFRGFSFIRKVFYRRRRRRRRRSSPHPPAVNVM